MSQMAGGIPTGLGSLPGMLTIPEVYIPRPTRRSVAAVSEFSDVKTVGRLYIQARKRRV
jgi:hypothetical protein